MFTFDFVAESIKEMEEEAGVTRKMLGIVPEDKFDWKPHPKSMSIRELSTHIAELPSWVSMAIHTDELDFAVSEYNPENIRSVEQLMAHFEENFAKAISDLKQVNPEILGNTWTLKTGDKTHWVGNKTGMIRMAFSQISHHRAQLGVYLRLLDIPIPGSYGPSADDTNF